MYILDDKKQVHVLKLLVEGASISSISRFTGVHRDTCTRLMLRFAGACEAFLDAEMRDLQFRHLEIDEMWTYCRKKEFNVTGEEADADEIGTFYLFLALDQDTRLIPTYRLDRRNGEATMAFMNDLASRLRWPKPHASDSHAFQRGQITPIVRISTDGFPPYPEAIDTVFGPYAQHAQIIKNEKGKKNKKKIEITKNIISPGIDPKDVSTSLVERSNLTTRNFMRRFHRKTIGFSKKLANLKAAVAIHFAYYNYCWCIKTFKATPAVKAGIASRRFKLVELYMQLRERFPEHFLGVERDAA